MKVLSCEQGTQCVRKIVKLQMLGQNQSEEERSWVTAASCKTRRNKAANNVVKSVPSTVGIEAKTKEAVVPCQNGRTTLLQSCTCKERGGVERAGSVDTALISERDGVLRSLHLKKSRVSDKS